MPTQTTGAPLALTARGRFDLRASSRFLEGFAPAGRPDAAADAGLLRLAFPAEAGWAPVGAAIRQHGPTVAVELSGEVGDRDAVLAQVQRILSLDVDGRAFLDIGRRDPVVGKLQARYPGLRPVLFHSPYEAACWSIVSQRIRITQAAVITRRLADQLGDSVSVAGQQLTAFPGPRRLRSLDTSQALTELTELPGIGPFYAQLILARGAGHPDLFPTAERRLHEEIASAYALEQPELDQLAAIAENWRPYRSWVGLLLRTRREDDTNEISRGRRRHR